MSEAAVLSYVDENFLIDRSPASPKKPYKIRVQASALLTGDRLTNKCKGFIR
jgi:hypothetical protein